MPDLLTHESQLKLKQAVRYFRASRDAGFQKRRLEQLADDTVKKVEGLSPDTGVVVMDDAGAPWMIVIDDDWNIQSIEQVQMAAITADPEFALPSAALVESAYIHAVGDPGAGVPPTTICVSGFVIDAACYTDQRDFRDVLESCRWKLESFAADVCDSAVKVLFDFEREAFEQQAEGRNLPPDERRKFNALVQVYEDHYQKHEPGPVGMLLDATRERIIHHVRRMLPNSPSIDAWYEATDTHRPWRIADRSREHNFELEYRTPQEAMAAALNFHVIQRDCEAGRRPKE